MHIAGLVKEKNIKMNLESETKEELFEEMVSFLVAQEDLPDRNEILKKFWEREHKMTTGIAPHIAIPHIHLNNIDRTMVVLGISRDGIDYDSLDGEDVHFVIMIVGIETQPEEHLKILKSLSFLLKNPDFLTAILKCKTALEVVSTIKKFEKNEVLASTR